MAEVEGKSSTLGRKSLGRRATPASRVMLKRASASTVALVSRLALPLVFLPVIAGQLSTAETGHYLLYLQLASWCALLAEFGAPLYLFELLSKSNDPRRVRLMFWRDHDARLLIYALVSPVIAGVGLLVGADLSLVLLALLLGWLLGSGATVLRQFGTSLFSLVGFDLISVAAYCAGMLIVFPLMPSAGAALACLALSLFLGQIVQAYAERPRGVLVSVRYPLRTKSHALRRWRLTLMRAAGAIQTQCAIPLAGAWFGLGAAGAYGVAERLFAVTANLSLILVTVASPILARAAKTDREAAFRLWRMGAAALVTLFCGIFALYVIGAAAIVGTLFPPVYAATAGYFPALAVVYGISILNVAILNGYLSPAGQAARLAPAVILAAVSTFAVSAALRGIGIEGILVGRAFAELLLAVAGIWLAWNLRRRPHAIGA
jgi:O-antigen/teichoic acid export membrane protein